MDYSAWTSDIEGFESPVFSRTAIITLPSREPNARRVIDRLGFANSAIVPATQVTTLPAEWTQNREPTLRASELACYCSHVTLWREWMRGRGDARDWMLVLEDDLVVPEAWVRDAMVRAMRDAPSDADIVYFGRCHDHCDDFTYVTTNVARVSCTLCTHAYAVTRDACKKLAGSVRLPVSEPVDVHICGLTRRRHVNAYATSVPLLFQNRESIPSELGHVETLNACSFKL